jgi:hypothetical protein
MAINHLRPCLHCAYREGCGIRIDILDRLRAAELKFSSISFRCGVRLTGFEIGRRVLVSLASSYDPDGKPHAYERHYGTIFKHVRSGKISIWLDSATSRGNVLVTLNPDYAGLQLLTETVTPCAECGKPPGAALILAEDRPWFCDKCGVPYMRDLETATSPE